MGLKKGITNNINGRPKGALNKNTIEIKNLIIDVLRDMQADKEHNMLQWAKSNPTEFYKIASKLLPSEVKNANLNIEATVIRVIRE